jgi:hypothetical protein
LHSHETRGIVALCNWQGLGTLVEVELTFYFFSVLKDKILLCLNLREIRVTIDIPMLASTAASVIINKDKIDKFRLPLRKERI